MLIFKGLDKLQDRFDVILIDPPWRYTDLGHTRRIDKEYPVLTYAEIIQLPIERLTTLDSVLFLWVPAPHLEAGLEIMGKWRFRYKSNIVWDKEIFGMGHYCRIQHEHLLLGVRGHPAPVADHSIPSIIYSKRGKHSVKPEESYLMIERLYPNAKKLELFARKLRYGWSCWGNEL